MWGPTLLGLGGAQLFFVGALLEPNNGVGFALHHLAQVGQTVKESALDGTDGAIECVSDLVVAESFAESQHKCLPLAVGEPRDSRPETLLPLVDFQVARRGDFESAVILPPFGDDFQAMLPGRSLSPFPPFEVEQDSVKPGEDTTAAGEAVGLPGEHEEGLLRQIVGVPRVAGQDQGRPVNPLEVLFADLIYVDRHDGERQWLTRIRESVPRLVRCRTPCATSHPSSDVRVPHALIVVEIGSPEEHQAEDQSTARSVLSVSLVPTGKCSLAQLVKVE